MHARVYLYLVTWLSIHLFFIKKQYSSYVKVQHWPNLWTREAKREGREAKTKSPDFRTPEPGCGISICPSCTVCHDKVKRHHCTNILYVQVQMLAVGMTLYRIYNNPRSQKRRREAKKALRSSNFKKKAVECLQLPCSNITHNPLLIKFTPTVDEDDNS